MRWGNPYSIDEWARTLGMAKVPLFALSQNSAVLLDGVAASLTLCAGEDAAVAAHERDPLSWAWSSQLRHLLALSEQTGELLLRRWDAPDEATRLKVPKSADDAEAILSKISQHRPRAKDVVSQMMDAFRVVRAVFAAYDQDDQVSIVRMFNLLVGALAFPNGRKELDNCDTVADVLALHDGKSESVSGISARYKNASLSDAIELVINSAPPGVPPLNSDLLIRHASGQLYQEAHFELERHGTGQMSLFGGLAPLTSTRGKQKRDARLTPNALARALVEQLLAEIDDTHPLTILDPACGSGVFLHEAMRELASRKKGHKIRLVGIDSSPVSIEIARFCLDAAAKDARTSGLDVEVDIKLGNSLAMDWGSPNAILMNPPFVSYRDMTTDERSEAESILGAAARGHYDKAMAFVWMAAAHVSANGAIASVLPSVLLSSTYGQAWREGLRDRFDMAALGRFRGYSYFPGALVEPSFIVMSQKPSGPSRRPLAVVVADEGSEDAALRALRKNRAAGTEGSGFSVWREYDRATVGTNWLPKSARHQRLLASLKSNPSVGEIFSVSQGALTGLNAAFIISDKEFESLPDNEHAYFRPAAGTTTIRHGRIEKTEFVFYPYGGELAIGTESRLAEVVPVYLERHLQPYKEKLLSRSDPNVQWWDLIRPRSWQLIRQPKIVTAYFGSRGQFAYDDTGDFVCVHGYAWQPHESTIYVDVDADDPEGVGIPFDDTDLPWAYVAVLNSTPFSVLLACHCTQVQGGQFNLSRRYVERIPVPQLSDGEGAGAVTPFLARLGRSIGRGEEVSHEDIDLLVSRAYGVALEEWELAAMED